MTRVHCFQCPPLASQCFMKLPLFSWLDPVRGGGEHKEIWMNAFQTKQELTAILHRSLDMVCIYGLSSLPPALELRVKLEPDGLYTLRVKKGMS